jgi:hypothetical protein
MQCPSPTRRLIHNTRLQLGSYTTPVSSSARTQHLHPSLGSSTMPVSISVRGIVLWLIVVLGLSQNLAHCRLVHLFRPSMPCRLVHPFITHELIAHKQWLKWIISSLHAHGSNGSSVRCMRTARRTLAARTAQLAACERLDEWLDERLEQTA